MPLEPHARVSTLRTSDAPTDPATEISRERYYSEAFLAQEVDGVFAAGWIAVAREDEVPTPGSYLCFDEVGASLIVLRDEAGGVGVFHNRCRHRGTRLVDGRGRAARLTCPYHGWCYRSDGSLDSVPEREGFPEASLAGGLEPVRSARSLGQVWVNLDGEAAPLDEYLGDVAARLAPYGQDDLVLVDQRQIELPCNWKALLDNTNEVYHLPSVHPRSVGRLDVSIALSRLGPHYELELTTPLSSLRKWADAWTLPAGFPLEAGDRARFRKFLVFPNTLINVLPYHTTVFRPYPLGPRRCRLYYGFYRPRRTGVLGRLRARVSGWLSRRVLSEDMHVMEMFQRGVESGGSGPIWLHPEHESALVHFHAALDAQLASKGKARPRKGPC